MLRCSFPKQHHNNRSVVVQSRYRHILEFQWEQKACNVLWHQYQKLFFDILAISAFQDRCLLTRTPTDFVVETCLIGKLSRTRLGDLSKVPNFCHDPITMNSVLVLLRVNLLAFSQSLTLVGPDLKYIQCLQCCCWHTSSVYCQHTLVAQS